jgi:chromate transporter
MKVHMTHGGDAGWEGAPKTDGTLAELVRYFLLLGTAGFGGPIALCGAMHRDLVERRRWVSETEYAEGIALAQLAPGPLAAQLAIYLGWLRGGWWGGTAVGIAFVAPSFVMVVALAFAYTRYGGLPWLQAAFYGIGAAVIAIIARSAGKLVRSTAGRDLLLWGLVAVNAVVTAVTERELISAIALSGAVALLVGGRPVIRRGEPTPGSAGETSGGVSTLSVLPVTVLAGLGSLGTSAQLFGFFLKAGAVVFGSGLAIVPFLYGGVVEQYGWLTEREFLDAVAVAMITPGPVVITVAFIGYLVEGFGGAVIAAAGVFLPAYLLVVLLAPSFRRFASNPRVGAFVAGVTAAATGALAGAVVVLGRRAIPDWTKALIAAATLMVLLGTKRIPEPLIIGAAGGVGLLLHG